MVLRSRFPFHGLLVLVFSAVISTHAAANWIALGPDGGSALALLVDASDPGRLLLSSDRAGLFESTNGALTFSPLADTPLEPATGGAIPIQTILQNPVAPEIVLAIAQFGTQRGWRSADGGRNWSAIDTIELTGGLAFNSDGSRVYGSTNTGPVLSLDNGATWSPLPLTGAPSSFNFGSSTRTFTSPSLPNRVYLIRSAQMIRSDDGGITWQSLAALPTGLSVNDFAVVDDAGETLVAVPDTAEGAIYSSSDSGASWSIETSGLVDPLGETAQITTLAIQRSTGALFALSEGRLHRSGGVGQAWSSSNLPARIDFADGMHFDSQDVERMFITARSGLFDSSDGGLAWQARTNGFRGQVVGALTTSRAVPSTILANSNSTAFSSSDFGNTWSDIGPRTLLNDSAFRPITSATDPLTLYAVSPLGTPMRSTNGGASWTLLTSPSDTFALDGFGWTMRVWSDPRDDSTLVAAELGFPSNFDSTGMFQSTDGGNTWSRRFAPPPDRLNFQPQSLADDPSRPGTVFFGIHSRTEAAFTDGLILRSTDGGATFDNLIDGFAFAEVAVDSVGSVFAGGFRLSIRQGVWRSTDGGDTWEPVNNGIPLPIGIIDITTHPVIPGRIVVATPTDLFETRDNGDSWQQISGNGLGRGNRIQSAEILPGDGEELELLVGTNRGVFYRNSALLNSPVPVPTGNHWAWMFLALLALFGGLAAFAPRSARLL